jgi:hypothetical protein
MQHLQWYPHVQAWRHRVERVIKHMDYAEYVGEDSAVLPHHRWNRVEDRKHSAGERQIDNVEEMATRVAGGSGALAAVDGGVVVAVKAAVG